MNTPTRDELLAELAADLTEPTIPENSITVRDLMDKTGRPEKACRTFLEKKIQQGKMAVVKVKITNYYYPV